MGALKEWAMCERERAHEYAGRLPIVNGRSLAWSDIEHVTEGQIGTFSLPCPYCGPEKRNSTRFRLERETLGRARWHCFYCGESGSLAIDGPADAERDAAARDAAIARRAEETAEKTARALKLWNQAVPVQGTVVLDYLAARAIHDLPPQVDDVLRFHPKCPLGQEGVRPCMLALMRDIRTDEPRAVHRTWVSENGKALGRMALGPIARAAVKLWPADNGKLVVGEGIETVLAAGLYVTGANGKACQPAWALTVAANLEHLPVLRGVRELLILTDNDANGVGQRAAQVCSQRWADAGRKVHKLMPDTTGEDFNDIVIARMRR